MTRFPMSLSRPIHVITGLSLLGAGAVSFVAATQLHAPPAVAALPVVVAVLVVAVVALAVLWAPRAVRLHDDAVIIERLASAEVRLPLAEVTSVEPGPALQPFGGRVWRVAGNGGVMGFTGLFFVRGVGLVRCWATRLGTPTVLLRRSAGRPVLLGVDEAPALLDALRQRLARR
jgi:hypothetical protein